MALTVMPVGNLGVEIHGIDLRTLSEKDFGEIKQHFAEQGVIFFRDQKIDEKDHIAFARRWGEININRFFAAHPDYPEIALVTKEPDQKENIGGGWHTDHSYDFIPALGSVLVARTLPKTGGDTLFASMYKAYETLDPDIKAEIEPLRARHSGKHIFGTGPEAFYQKGDGGSAPGGSGRIGNAALADTLEDPVHPVVLTHPLSGKKALYVNPAFTREIVDYDTVRSEALLKRLYTHIISDPSLHARFNWQEGSIAMWDNRSTWHWALNDYHGQRREMHRITIEGCRLD